MPGRDPADKGQLEMLASFDEHGVIDQHGDGLWQTLESGIEDGVENVMGEGNIVMFGHGCGELSCGKPNHTLGRTLPPQGACRSPGLPAASLRCAFGRPGERQSSKTTFTDERLHYHLHPHCIGEIACNY